MNVPSWWSFLLLALAAYRTWRLLSEDDILDRPRRYVTRLGDWTKGPTPQGYRYDLAAFINCPACLGAWCSLGWWLAWLAFPHGVLVVAVPFAISQAVIIVRSVLDTPE